MRQIEVKVLDEHEHPESVMMLLARLTQSGHKIDNMGDLLKLREKCLNHEYSAKYTNLIRSIACLPHGTIKRFTPITVAIVGASRRFLAQARTHQVGFNYVSASLQYSDYSGTNRFVVPYSIIKADDDAITEAHNHHLNPAEYESYEDIYISSCEEAMDTYKKLAEELDNDTAGYAAPQGLRNVLIMQGNHEAWCNFIKLRACNRNTEETQYVALRIWEELVTDTFYGEAFFSNAEPQCLYNKCEEGKFSCYATSKRPLAAIPYDTYNSIDTPYPTILLNNKFPLVRGR